MTENENTGTEVKKNYAKYTLHKSYTEKGGVPQKIVIEAKVSKDRITLKPISGTQFLFRNSDRVKAKHVIELMLDAMKLNAE